MCCGQTLENAFSVVETTVLAIGLAAITESDLLEQAGSTIRVGWQSLLAWSC